MDKYLGKIRCCKGIYLDNNSTTVICKAADDARSKLKECYNPSSDNKFSKNAKDGLEKSRKCILSHCKVNTSSHTVIFTSGGTESNCLICRSTIDAYGRINKCPHVITSEIEHHSILKCLKLLEEQKKITVSYVKPNVYGIILPEEVEKLIRKNTCLISIMFANNETGAINNIPEIVNIAQKYKIPVHSDAVQLFGKHKINLKKIKLAAISASAHKFHGPKGVGICILRNDFIDGYKLKSQIEGSQQFGLRGGTENVPGIVASAVALESTFNDRILKNKRHLIMRNMIISGLKEIMPQGHFIDYVLEKEVKPLAFVILGPPENKHQYFLNNTLLISFAKTTGRKFCNVLLRKKLDKKGVIVSISSACLTKNKNASHVLTAMRAPDVIKRGAIRISVGDSTKISDIRKFLLILKSVL